MLQTPVTTRNRFGLRGRSGKYLHGAVGLVGLRFTSIGVGLIVTALLSRGLGVTEFGIFSFAISLATLLALPLTGGLPTLLMREIAVAEAQNAPAVRAGLIRWSYRVMATVSGVLALFAITLWWLGQETGLWPWTPKETTVAALVVLLVPTLSLQQVQRGILEGSRKVVAGSLGEQLLRPALMALFVIILGAWIWPGGAPAALGVQLTATAAAIVLSFALMRHLLPPMGATDFEIRNREWLWALLPLTAISTTTILKNNTDVLMLGLIATPAEIGIYRIASQIAGLSLIATQIMRSLSAPRVAAAFTKGDEAAMQRHLIKAGRVMFGTAAVFVVLFAAFGQPALVWVFGPDYAGAWAPCLALSIAALFSSACGLVAMTLQVTKYANLSARAAVNSAIVNVILNLALIPLWGSLGAAVATAIATATMQAQQWQAARRVLGMRTDAFQRMMP